MATRPDPGDLGHAYRTGRDATVLAARALIRAVSPTTATATRDLDAIGVPDLIRHLMLAEQAIQRHSEAGRLTASDAARLLRRAAILTRLLERRDRPRDASSLTDALVTATEELCGRYGFDRTMAFEVLPSGLHIRATCFSESPLWRDEIHQRMVDNPPPHELPGREARVARERRTLIVSDAQDDPDTWKPLVRPAEITSYVSAPVIVNGATVATLHADRHFQRTEVTVEDRDLVGLVAFEVSVALSTSEREQENASVLTEQQQRVLEGAAAGLTNRQIATALFVSAETVKSHLVNIYRRLEVSNRIEAVGKFYDLDLRPPRDRPE